jgi:hypothetical protein
VIPEEGDRLALGELEMGFAVDLLSWLCKRHVIGSITLRNALLAIRPPDKPNGKPALRPQRTARSGHRW